ncbi:MAG: tyrosine-type recombinase/integrase [Ignavibacteriaceae bacterium]
MLNPEYKLLIQGFEKWLKTLEYAESTVYASTNYLRDFFTYLQKSGIVELQEINKTVIEIYHEHLQTRRNKKQAGSLSQNYIVSNINALRRFVKYLQVTGKPVFEISLKIPIEKEKLNQTVLTRTEVKALYNACNNDDLGLRDRAMLAIYYGCGLRRNEGVSLDVSDVLIKEKLLYVQKGKGYRERYVPMSEAVKEDLENYINVARGSLLSCELMKQQALLLSFRGKRMDGNSLIMRLKALVKGASINKSVGLHTLRHSIATHLLQSGMSLESVSRFLGHQSLESTQIYTHLANE